MEPPHIAFKVGMSVMIRRSNGETHAATVKNVNELESAVNVEWKDNGILKGKEIAMSDLWALNAHLLQQPTPPNPPAPPSQPAVEASAQKKYEGMQPPADTAPQAGPSEEPVSRRFMCSASPAASRQPTAAGIAASGSDLSNDMPSSAISRQSQDVPPSAIPRPSGLPVYPKRTRAKQAAQPPVIEAACESEEARCAPVKSTARRMTMTQNGGAVGGKRMSIMPKTSETQNKKVKAAEVSQPNRQFYQMIMEYRETVEKVPLLHSDDVENPRICVCVRKRPLNKKEVTAKEIDVVTIPGNGHLIFHEPKHKVDLTKYLENQPFQFDYSFDEDATNEIVYRYTARPLVHTIFEGGMATCFAYGQTGSGKTHTMGGDFSGKNQKNAKGIYALAAQDVFALLRQYPDIEPFVSFFEIYNGKVFDLLNKKAKLRVLEDERQQVQVVGLQEMSVTSVGDVIKMIERGSACRTSGQTFANANSSRSHAVLQIVLRRGRQLHGKFSLVDLAGNERGADVQGNDRQTLVETTEINRSLLALKECIRSLGHNSEHIPFRMSKLTQVLRDSFIGENSKTCMIAMISPGRSSCDYTINTLRYANRVKELNGTSKVVPDAGNKGDLSTSCSSSDDSIVPLYDAISRVNEMEEKLREEFLAGRDFCASLTSPTFDILAQLPEIKEFYRRSLDLIIALEEAVKAEEDLTAF